MVKRHFPHLALCAVLLAALACGGPVTPTPTLAPTARPSDTLPAPTLPTFTPTVVEQVVTLTPKAPPTATIIAIATASKAAATNPPAASATRTRLPAPTNTRAPAFTATPAPVVIQATDTPAPILSTQPPAARARTGAQCVDGTISTATGSGACSRHGGVQCWFYTDGTCTKP